MGNNIGIKGANVNADHSREWKTFGQFGIHCVNAFNDQKILGGWFQGDSAIYPFAKLEVIAGESNGFAKQKIIHLLLKICNIKCL